MQLSDLIDDIRPDMVQAPNLAMLDALQKSTMEFFDVSETWRLQLDAITMRLAVASYDLPIPDGTRITRILESKSETRDLFPLSETELFRLDPTATGDPMYIALSDADDLLLVNPVPNAAAVGKTIRLMVVLTIDRETLEIPDALGKRFRHGIISGAKSRLFLTPDRPYTDFKLGSLHEGIYRSQIADAKREGVSGRFARPLTVVQRRFV